MAQEAAPDGNAHPMGADGQFHVTDEPIDLGTFASEDWISLVLFWALAFVVFYQVFTRYFLGDPAGWTEEIARYLLVAVVFIGASMSVRKNNHIQVDVFYRLMPGPLQRVLSTAVDLLRLAFLGYATWLAYLLTQRIGGQRMAIVDLPMGLVFGAIVFGFAVMTLRAAQVALRHWRDGYSVLERPELALDDAAAVQGTQESTV
jgi:TRAP-type transport system small permease protein